MEYIFHILILVSIYAILAASLNLTAGHTGLMDFSVAAYYGIGAYAVAILVTRYNFSWLLSAVIGMVVCAIVASIFSKVLNIFNQDKYSIVSLGFAVIIHGIFLNLEPLTKGAVGIFGFKTQSLGPIILTTNTLVILSLVLVMAISGLIYMLSKSQFGHVLRAVREQEKTVSRIGFNTKSFRGVAYIIAAVGAAVAGSVFAGYVGYINPALFTFNESIYILSIVIVGGLASLRGSVLAAAVLVVLPELFRYVGWNAEAVASLRQALYGLSLIAVLRFRPKGLFGKYIM